MAEYKNGFNRMNKNIHLIQYVKANINKTVA